MSVTVSLALAMRKMTRANCAGAPARRLRDDRLGHGDLLRQDRHADAEQDAGRSRSASDGSVFERDAPTGRRRDRRLAAATARRSTGSRSTPPSTRPPTWRRRTARWSTVGNTTEGALLHWLRRGAAIDYARSCALQYPVLYQIHFSSDRKRMTTVVRHGGRLVALVKGAPEMAAGAVRHATSPPTAPSQPLTPDARATIQAQLARRGRRGDADAGLRLRRAAGRLSRATRTRCTHRRERAGERTWSSSASWPSATRCATTSRRPSPSAARPGSKSR